MTLTRHKHFFLLALLILLNACSMDIFNSQDEVDISQFTDLEKKSKTYVYECQSGNSFVVNIEGRMAWVFLPEQTVGLPKISSASGVKYTDGLFWSTKTGHINLRIFEIGR